ncbi:MAG: hypothetical protein CVU56_17475 [Deltaproteobacteria bacterium HGW-Deltaproteobacteria-14]|jgi:hypothetical protein|nr:MAG: hypothetical protein CVU56_17475 [Deltaproteobacteria bacterium HGW-Deltaproteobacteria-14]
MTQHLTLGCAALALLLGGALTACDAPATRTASTPPAVSADEAPETLALALGPRADEVITVDLVYRRRAEQVAPRMMELWIDRGPGLTYLGAESLAATMAADKDLVVQDRGDALRIVVYASSNLTELDSGPLARLTFRRVAGADATLTLIPQLPIFAPASANDGLLLGPPLVLTASSATGGTP